MTEIEKNMQRVQEKKETTLTPRQEKILTAEIKERKTKSVRQIAKKLGIDRATYYRNLKKIGNVSDWKERQVERLKGLEHLVFAGLLANIEKGNYDAIRDWYLKFAHLFTDQLDIVGRMQSMSDDELIEKAKTAIMTAVKQKKLEGKALGKPKELNGGHVESSEGIVEDKTEFNGEGLA